MNAQEQIDTLKNILKKQDLKIDVLLSKIELQEKEIRELTELLIKEIFGKKNLNLITKH